MELIGLSRGRDDMGPRLILLSRGMAHLQEPVTGQSYCGRTMDLRRTEAHTEELRRGEFQTCSRCLVARNKAENASGGERPTPKWAPGTTRRTLHRVKDADPGVGECGWPVLPEDENSGSDRAIRPGCRLCVRICLKRDEQIPQRLLAVYKGPGSWRDEKDVNEVVNSAFRDLPTWMASSTRKVRHKREAPDSLVSLCGQLLHPEDEAALALESLRACTRCLAIEAAKGTEPWGGGDMVVSGGSLPAEAEEKAAAERVLDGYEELRAASAGNEWGRGHRHHADPPANETRGKDDETPERTIARLRAQNARMGEKWNLRMADMQRELDGLRNLVREGVRYAERLGQPGSSVSGSTQAIVTALLNELELARGERDAFRDRMHKSNLAMADAKRQAEEYREALLRDDRRLQRVVRQALVNWGGDSVSGNEAEVAERVLDALHREEQVRGPRR